MKNKKLDSKLYAMAAIIFIILGISKHELIWFILGCACLIFSGIDVVKKK